MSVNRMSTSYGSAVGCCRHSSSSTRTPSMRIGPTISSPCSADAGQWSYTPARHPSYGSWATISFTA